MMRDPVQKSSSHLAIGKDLRPFSECQISSYKQRSPFIELRYHMEQELAPVFRKRQISQLIQDNKVPPCKSSGQPSTATGKLFLLKLVNQIDYIEETAPFAVLNRLPGYGYCQMCLAGTGAANQDHIALCAEEVPLMQRPYKGFIDRRSTEVESVQVLVYREPCQPQTVDDASGRAL